jgi:hypothetical protein
LCFKCGEKYTPTHTCSNAAPSLQLMESVSGDGGDFLSDETLSALEATHLYMMQYEGYLSLHAMSGKPQNKALQLRALVQNQALVILVDSGSSPTFLNSVIAKKLQVQPTAVAPMTVKVANGAMLSRTAEAKHFQWWCQGNTFQVNAKIIDMGAYDLVLGMDWLATFRPMMCDWLEKWIEFQHQGKVIQLQGIQYSQPKELKEISMEQVVKWEKGNDLWVDVVIETGEKSPTLIDTYLQEGIPAQVKELIHEFGSVFQVPSTLPPSRDYDHAITLLPNSAPVNCRPYRYSPEQKDEIER